jgi:hypothetical protein
MLGDKNTKFFHKYASYRRNKKHIWEVKDESDQVFIGQEAIKGEAVRHFSTFFKESQLSIVDQIEAVRLYPILTTYEEVNALEKPVSKVEILEVLKGLTKEKSHGLDGWIVEFFLHFFDLVADDLWEVVEESRISGMVNRSLNSMFIVLIPKVNGPSSFGEFGPIALCNLCYKIITKILATWIRPILSHTLSAE